MLSLSRDEISLVSGAGPISVIDLLPIIPLATSIGAAVGTSGAIEAAGGLGAYATLGGSTLGIGAAGVASAFIAGFGIGSLLGTNDEFKDGLSDVFLEIFGTD
jgi:hypothetical protein